MMRNYTVSLLLFLTSLTTLLAPGSAYAMDFSGHYGIDITCSLGGKVLASDAGVVASVTPLMRGENRIVIRTHGGGECHFIYVKPLVKQGQTVNAGEVIGECDDSAPTVRGVFHYAYRPAPDKFFINPRDHLPENSPGEATP